MHDASVSARSLRIPGGPDFSSQCSTLAGFRHLNKYTTTPTIASATRTPTTTPTMIGTMSVLLGEEAPCVGVVVVTADVVGSRKAVKQYGLNVHMKKIYMGLYAALWPHLKGRYVSFSCIGVLFF
ncbi:hypothetical protein DPMN_190457 [Dreissena polymorpha]|uniref:Uncharacterized protein n=1 Tax=Dreissena polymorpha TaxID=45954 RepID=A0A9D4DV10_DREPO|nr:hypothetical protein DPMN_190457 [Dreissena polymorpha]